MKMLYALLLLIVAVPAVPGTAMPASSAEAAARAWLALVDAGRYADSWSSAAGMFRQKITASQWAAAAAGARAPLGALKSRTLQSATPRSTLPGAPDGEYVVIQFASSFEHKASAVETVTPMKDADGRWHVSGYFVQ
ncbi:MAG TPA: DUF4019 domain-containing protein [Steroidobacteraceae bacterium]|jgi:hypothetical protein